MSGSKIGSLKRKSGFGKKGYKPGTMLMKSKGMKYKYSLGDIGKGIYKGAQEVGKVGAQLSGVNMDWTGERKALSKAGNFVKTIGNDAVNTVKAFGRNATGGDVKGILKKKSGMKCKMTKAKPQGRGITRALGQGDKKTGNFAKIAASKGKGAAIAALQNKLAKRRGK